MITNRYQSPNHTFTVTEHDCEELHCECPPWRASKLEMEHAWIPHPVPVCGHLLNVQREGLDRGFLAKADDQYGFGLVKPIIGWALSAGGFVRVIVDRLAPDDAFWQVMVPVQVAPEAPAHPSGEGWSIVGLVQAASAGRKELAQAVAPYYATYGLRAGCGECGRTVFGPSTTEPTPEDGLADANFRLSAVLWGVWLAHHDLCPECDGSDLIPSV